MILVDINIRKHIDNSATVDIIKTEVCYNLPSKQVHVISFLLQTVLTLTSLNDLILNTIQGAFEIFISYYQNTFPTDH